MRAGKERLLLLTGWRRNVLFLLFFLLCFLCLSVICPFASTLLLFGGGLFSLSFQLGARLFCLLSSLSFSLPRSFRSGLFL
jgi:hypothetical protein